MIALHQRREGRTVHVEGAGSFGDFFEGLATDPAAFQALLRELPYDAVSWELPPLEHLDDPFHCVLLDHPGLVRMPVDRSSFAEHWRPDATAVHFRNLGGDSELVAPCPRDGLAYTHLLAWARLASSDEARSLWSLVAHAVRKRLQGTQGPTWLSTAGMGVGWLHVRLDPRPKYYRHAPYRRWP